MSRLVYFSSNSQTTRRFVDKLGVGALRLALDAAQPPLELDEPYILLTPTYGGGGQAGAVPKPVIRFLNHPRNRSLLRGVIATGNIGFGAAFALAGKIVAAKCSAPLLYRFELCGTVEDVNTVRQGLERFWTR